MIYKVLGFSILASSAVATQLSSASPEMLKMMFDAFKKQHGRNYSTMDEEVSRFQNFVNNLKLIDERNAKEHGSAVHGINIFADWSHEEFAGKFFGYQKSDEVRNVVAVPAYTGSQSVVDWTGVYTTPVRDQGACGSCWAHAASEQIESDAMRELGVYYSLSPEQMVACDRTSMGCNGGLQERAYNYVKRAGGIQEESTYPYESGDGTTDACASDKSKFVLTVTSFAHVEGEADMASYVKSTGPLSIAVDATTWSTYTGGIVTSCGSEINHAVQLVGVDTAAGYWKIRNSWSTEWGESGFIRVAYGQDMCGLTYDVTYTSVAEV